MAKQQEPQEKKGTEPLTGDDVPEIIRDIDMSWLIGKAEKGETLTIYQRCVLIEDTRYRVGKKLVVSKVAAAYTLRELRSAGATAPTTEGNPATLDDVTLLRKLETTAGLKEFAEELGKSRSRMPKATPESTGEQPRMSAQQCISQIAQALRHGNYDFAVTHAEEAAKLYEKTPQVLYMAALAYAHSAAKNITAEPTDRIADHKRAIHFFDRCLELTANIPGYAEIEANARTKRLEILPMAEQLETLRRKRQEKK